ncbi:hypothetical protein BN873_980020 [Candidatus Competibacter denitrificans Run_A_D11]|uniref:Uncharacterized protein n=1 Tax=Candidatus Competibacter denitrificans Run_A_D11 TaxID=1400863 RepID=W6MBP0_9GAMM|nr:hypothetical protein BN873_980020 [Candidatus Competibacter denitrificans Run_A_D11]
MNKSEVFGVFQLSVMLGASTPDFIFNYLFYEQWYFFL